MISTRELLFPWAVVPAVVITLAGAGAGTIVGGLPGAVAGTVLGAVVGSFVGILYSCARAS